MDSVASVGESLSERACLGDFGDLDSLPVPIWGADREGRLIYANSALLRVLGNSEKACDAIDGLKSCLSPDGTHFETKLRAHATESERFTGEFEILTAAGVRRWVLIEGSRYHDQAGHFAGFMGTLVDLEPQKTVESHLRRQCERFRCVFESDMMGVFFWKSDGLILDANKAFLDLTGYDQADLAEGRVDWAQMTPEKWVAADQKALAELEQKGVCQPFQKEYIRKDGQIIPVFLGGAFLPGSTDEGVAFVIDICKQKQAEAALREAESQLRAMFETSGVGKVQIDFRTGRLLRINQRFAALTGYSVDELTGRSFWEFIHVEDRPMIRFEEPNAADAIQENRVRELRLVQHSGHVIWVEITWNVVQISDRSGPYVFAVVFDTSTRRKAEEALRHNEERFRAFFDSDIIGTLFGDVFGGIFEANDEFLRIVGYSREDLAAGKVRWDWITPPEFIPRDTNGIKEAQSRGTCVPYEKQYIRKDGTRIWVLVGYVLLGPHRENAMAFILDQSERKKAEEALREADRRKNEFLAMLAHELRNPLGPILNAVELLSHAQIEDESFARAREIIGRQTTHMAGLVDELLDVARLTLGRINLKLDIIDLNQLVADVAFDYAESFEQAGLDFKLQLPSSPVRVYGDSMRLSQIVGNLLHNARKFTATGGHVAVTLTTDPIVQDAILSIRDDGEGIETNMLANVRELFNQADRSLDRSRGGLGLGLPLVQSLVAMHNGDMQIKSEGLGKGTIVRIRLPLAPIAAERRVEAAIQSQALRSRKVLIIEDNKDSAESMQLLLALSGHQVAVAHSGPEGLEKALQFLPEVVICDLGLPGGMDGFAVARAFRNNPVLKSAHLLTVSGYGMHEDLLRAKAAGFERHFTKPVDLREIESAFREFDKLMDSTVEQNPTTTPTPTQPGEQVDADS